MNTEVRIAVIGAGVMGANHARVARNVPGASLAAVIDQDLDRAAAVAGEAQAGRDIDEFLEAFDLAVIAVPTAAHADLACDLFDQGKHVLVEKPIASSPELADRMIAKAEGTGLTLAVGHIERFNAAVRELPHLLEDPIHIRATRVSPYSPRISDGVVHDLMIHDLDIVLSLIGGGASVEAVSGSARAVRGDAEDLANATATFSNGLTASFETSRVAQQKVRQIEVTQHDSVIVADLVRQDVTIHRMSRHEYLADDGVRYRQSSVVEIPFIDQRGEPLQRELEDVVASIRERRAPTVTGEDGAAALRLADSIAEALVRT